jgi:hypothetical protein
MTQATDIIKQMQKALKDTSCECNTGKCNSCHVLSYLLPELLQIAERWDKGVSLEEMTEAAITYRALCTCYRLNKRPSEKLFTRLEKAKAVLDKAGVNYHD